MSVEEKVIQVIADRVKGAKVEDITLQSTLSDIGADSLDTVEIILEIEGEYKIKVSEQDYEKLNTVQDIVGFIHANAEY